MKKLLTFLFAIAVLCTSCSKDSTVTPLANDEDTSDNETDTTQDTNDDSDTPLASMYFPPNGSSEWERISADELGWNTAEEEALMGLLEANGTKAFIILKNGRIVLEQYFDQHTQDSNWYWASAGKTLTAFTVGLAQEQGLLNLSDKTSDYLGEGWTSTPQDKEDLITIWHQLTMTTGLNDLAFECITSNCLDYVANAGTRWAYHNGPYTLLQDVVANATNQNWTDYFATQLRDRIGMDGFWLNLNPNRVYFSTARSMARFGLLSLNNGAWDDEIILGNEDYLNAMKTSSQDFNKAYGYLWWLNGKDSYMSPALQIVFEGALIQNAPFDTYAGLGKDDQKLYIVPSQGLVIVRQGEDAGEGLLGPSSFDNLLWEQLNNYMN